MSIRGLDSSYTLTLVDGKSINSCNEVLCHNNFDLNWIPVNAIERIGSGAWAHAPAVWLRYAGKSGQHYYQKIGQKWHGSVIVNSIIQEHLDRSDTYNGQFVTSGPLIDGVLGLKVYGNLAKHEKNEQQHSVTTTTTETPRIGEWKRRIYMDTERKL